MDTHTRKSIPHAKAYHTPTCVSRSYKPGGLGSVVDGKDVVAIDSDGRHSVAGTTRGDSVPAILLISRSRNGVTIISDSMTIHHYPFKSLVLSRSPAGISQDAASKHLFQRLALSVQKGNAALILSRSTDIHSYDMLGEY